MSRTADVKEWNAGVLASPVMQDCTMGARVGHDMPDLR